MARGTEGNERPDERDVARLTAYCKACGDALYTEGDGEVYFSGVDGGNICPKLSDMARDNYRPHDPETPPIRVISREHAIVILEGIINRFGDRYPGREVRDVLDYIQSDRNAEEKVEQFRREGYGEQDDISGEIRVDGIHRWEHSDEDSVNGS